MKKVTLSALAALMVSGLAYADTLTLYTDPKTGQVYTTPGEGRIEMGDFIDAKTVYMENQDQDSKIAKEKAAHDKKGYVPVKSKGSKLEFSGTHYLGYVYTDTQATPSDPNIDGSTSTFETRRNYFQVKAYLFDDPKSYLRVTMDTTSHGGDDYWDVILKYAYLYMDDILPYTGVEIGQVHRPWIDYEEHQGWWYRSISKVFVEADEGAHLTNSADLGFNFKTKTPYFQSELGVFNGEGYHSDESGDGNSFEWRLTGTLLGNGDKKRKPTKDSYLDVSFFGQLQQDSAKNDSYDYAMYGGHVVYNQPAFLVSAQYVEADTDSAGGDTYSTGHYEFDGKGYSVNGTFRFGENYAWEVLGRYDSWKKTSAVIGLQDLKSEYWLAGVGYQYNKNVKFIANYLEEDPDKDTSLDEEKRYMFTAEVHW